MAAAPDNGVMIVLGKIVEAHGIGGWVRVHPIADGVHDWMKLSRWWLSASPQTSATPEAPAAIAWSDRELGGARMASGKLLVKLSGIDDRDAALALKGCLVAAPRAALPEPADGEYYWDDLIGLRVVNVQGEALGVVEAMLETGANDVMVTRDGDSQRLIPFLAHVVRSVRIAQGEITVDWEASW